MTKRADAAGARYHGKACRWGHGTERYRKHDACVVCTRMNARKQREKKGRVYSRRLTHLTPERRHGALNSANIVSDRVPPLTDFRGEAYPTPQRSEP